MKGLEALKSRRWWSAAGTRALKTLAQTAIGALIAESIWRIDWLELAGIAVMPAVISLLTSLAGLPEVDDEEILKEVEKEFREGDE